MKRDTLILIAAALLAGVSVLRSQDATATGKDPIQMLKTLKASNADLIDAQKKTLDGLDETTKTADQIRILAKRT